MVAQILVKTSNAVHQIFNVTFAERKIGSWEQNDWVLPSARLAAGTEVGPGWLAYRVLHYMRWDRIKEISLAPGQSRTESLEWAVGVENSVAETLRKQKVLSYGLTTSFISLTGQDETDCTKEIRINTSQNSKLTTTDSWNNSKADQVQEISIWQRIDVLEFQAELNRLGKFLHRDQNQNLISRLGNYRIEVLADAARTKSRYVLSSANDVLRIDPLGTYLLRSRVRSPGPGTI